MTDYWQVPVRQDLLQGQASRYIGEILVRDVDGWADELPFGVFRDARISMAEPFNSATAVTFILTNLGPLVNIGPSSRRRCLCVEYLPGIGSTIPFC